MAELKIGGSDVVKIMYGDQEIGGATKLEPGTILYMSEEAGYLRNVHLLSTTKNWNSLNGITVKGYGSSFNNSYFNVDIPSDDFKSLDAGKEYPTDIGAVSISRSIVDGEYRLNVSIGNLYYEGHVYFVIKVI